jgi:trehalose 6-phosphate phosphatase
MIITDIDGTIANIELVPSKVMITQDMRNVLTKLTSKFKKVVVLSGRSREDAIQIVNINNIVYIGNHGLEWNHNTWNLNLETLRYQLKRFQKEIEDKIIDDPNILLENKGLTLAIHYRNSEKTPENIKKIIERINTLENSNKFTIKEGKQILDIKPALIIDKGIAIEELQKKYNIKQMIFLGDDITDVDGFKKIHNLALKKKIRGKSIVVISDETIPEIYKNADYYVKNVNEVKIFLEWLIS